MNGRKVGWKEFEGKKGRRGRIRREGKKEGKNMKRRKVGSPK